jgi:hypothetical protein
VIALNSGGPDLRRHGTSLNVVRVIACYIQRLKRGDEMARIFLSLCGALALAFAAETAQAQSLVGTWSATVNWNLPSGIMITSSFTPDGRLQSTTQNHMGQSFILSGTYQFDPGQGILRFQWQDYAPKQICTGSSCTPASAPAPMGVATTNSIHFLNANQFVASSPDGATVYVRTNGAGFPTR